MRTVALVLLCVSPGGAASRGPAKSELAGRAAASAAASVQQRRGDDVRAALAGARRSGDHNAAAAAHGRSLSRRPSSFTGGLSVSGAGGRGRRSKHKYLVWVGSRPCVMAYA